MWSDEYEAYILNDEQFSQLSSYTEGWEDWSEEGLHIANIYDDDILKALGLGAYSGGGIDINDSHQGGPM